MPATSDGGRLRRPPLFWLMKTPVVFENLNIAGRPCAICRAEAPRYLLIQPADDHDLEGLRRQAETMAAQIEAPFLLAAFRIERWFSELSPWDAPAVFGREPFGHGAPETLEYIRRLLPELASRYAIPPTAPVILGGYSLAGLFALWAACQTDAFAAVAAASPSVWFPGWIDYARSHRTMANHVYLSLGDREERARNPVMATVGRCVREQYDILKDSLGAQDCALEWNEGNHFRDPDIRCAKAFAWCTGRMEHSS